MASSSQQEVTEILRDWSDGDTDAPARLITLVYDELRRLANHYLSLERSDHTLQPTALVHEAYLRLVDQRNVDWKNRAQFFGVAAQMMRRILVDHARGHKAEKRGGKMAKLSLEDARCQVAQQAADLVTLNEALCSLEEIAPRKARVVELRFFGGLSVEETAEVLEVSVATVMREWTLAKAWLYREVRGDESAEA